VSITALCKKVGMTRQNYYKQTRERHAREVDEELIIALVHQQRRQHPRIGGRKLHRLLHGDLEDAGVSIGRDALFDMLREHGLLVEALPKAPRTTNSRHSLPVFRNLIRDLTTTAPNQIWVSDITYLRLEDSFVYLALIMDLYSRKVVGYHCGDSLESIGCVTALEQALAELPEDRFPIHHSDRGCQYCCHEYVERLFLRDLSVSMTEENHCYENAHAERVNGILKQEYGLRMTFRNADQARRAVSQAVSLYNNRRPHTSLQYRVPAEVHRKAA